MIIGFAHIAINIDKIEDLKKLYCNNGYLESNSFYSVKNHSSKKSFCYSFQKKHDLIILNSTKNFFSIELTCHGKTTGFNKQLKIEDKKIIVKTQMAKEFHKFCSQGLGFSSISNRNIKFSSINPSWSCELIIEKKDSNSSRIDANGPSCLAFYSSNIIEDRKNLIKLGATDYSDVFNLSLGVKSMDIFMTRAPGGILIELIQIRKNNDS